MYFSQYRTHVNDILVFTPVADPGFSRGGGANSKRSYYLAILFPKTAWNWKNFDPQGVGACLSPPLDPPMHPVPFNYKNR